MRIQAAYVTSEGRVRAEFRNVEVTGSFMFVMADESGDLGIYMDRENEANARIAVAAMNGEWDDLRRLLDVADAELESTEAAA